jgi:hypothetical protein
MSDAKPAGARKRKRKTKSATQASAKTSPDAAGQAASRENPAATDVPAGQAKPNVTSVTRNVDLDWDPAAPDKTKVAAASRSSFPLRPEIDLKDL